MSLMLIGFGAIAQGMLRVLAAQGALPAQVTVLARPGRGPALRDAGRGLLPGTARLVICERLDTALATRPETVVECAGHGALASHGAAVLRAGHDLIAASVGALADDGLRADLLAAARAGQARLHLPAGAIGGIDLIAAARAGGACTLHYTGTKPPAAWRGSAAEAVCDLSDLRSPVELFRGSAREAALAYPRNANVAAMLALAGPGLDATGVTLIADPGVQGNLHRWVLGSDTVRAQMEILGQPSSLTPGTSATTALSLARAVLNRQSTLVI